MSESPDSTREIWQSVLSRLTSDERITPQLLGFVSLVEPKGVMAGTLYLEVPNELTRGMLEQRIRWRYRPIDVCPAPEHHHDRRGRPAARAVRRPGGWVLRGARSAAPR